MKLTEAERAVIRRFVKRSIYTDSNCCEWIGYRREDGYGQIRVDGYGTIIHRIAYQILVGPIPPGLTIDHTCRNRACWHVGHMEVVTQRENTLRGNTLQAENAAKTHCIHGHPFDEMNTIINKHGWRNCRTCDKARKAKR